MNNKRMRPYLVVEMGGRRRVYTALTSDGAWRMGKEDGLKNHSVHPLGTMANQFGIAAKR